MKFTFAGTGDVGLSSAALLTQQTWGVAKAALTSEVGILNFFEPSIETACVEIGLQNKTLELQATLDIARTSERLAREQRIQLATEPKLAIAYFAERLHGTC